MNNLTIDRAPSPSAAVHGDEKTTGAPKKNKLRGTSDFSSQLHRASSSRERYNTVPNTKKKSIKQKILESFKPENPIKRRWNVLPDSVRINHLVDTTLKTNEARDLMQLAGREAVRQSVINNLTMDGLGTPKSKLDLTCYEKQMESAKSRIASDLRRLQDVDSHTRRLLGSPPSNIERQVLHGAPADAACAWIADCSSSTKLPTERASLKSRIKAALIQGRDADPLSIGTIMDLHDMVYEPAPGEPARTFRSSSDEKFAGSDVSRSAFENFMIQLKAENTINRDQLADLLFAAVVRYHPFGDGNGRTARCIYALVQLQNKNETFMALSKAAEDILNPPGKLGSAPRTQQPGSVGKKMETKAPDTHLAVGNQTEEHASTLPRAQKPPAPSPTNGHFPIKQGWQDTLGKIKGNDRESVYIKESLSSLLSIHGGEVTIPESIRHLRRPFENFFHKANYIQHTILSSSREIRPIFMELYLTSLEALLRRSDESTTADFIVEELLYNKNGSDNLKKDVTEKFYKQIILHSKNSEGLTIFSNIIEILDEKCSHGASRESLRKISRNLAKYSSRFINERKQQTVPNERMHFLLEELVSIAVSDMKRRQKEEQRHQRMLAVEATWHQADFERREKKERKNYDSPTFAVLGTLIAAGRPLRTDSWKRRSDENSWVGRYSPSDSAKPSWRDNRETIGILAACSTMAGIAGISSSNAKGEPSSFTSNPRRSPISSDTSSGSEYRDVLAPMRDEMAKNS